MKIESLKKRSDFERVYKEGKKISGRFLRFYFIKHPVEKKITRIGISTNKKIGPAVLRNTIRRVFKEYTRKAISKNAVNFDVLFIANKNIDKDTLVDFKEELNYLINRFLVFKD